MTIRESGFSLIELVIFILVVGICVPPIMLMLGQATTRGMKAQIMTKAEKLASELMEEIQAKRFDENSPVPPYTAWNALGPEAGENRPDYDDLDDYHGMSNSPPQDSAGHQLNSYSTYTCSVNVCYVSSTELNTSVSSETDYKRISVSVTHPDIGQITLVSLATNW